jgi:hypothetical protein
MRKASLLAAIVMAFGLVVALATNSSASPSNTDRCDDCHTGIGVTVSASLVSSTTADATYNITGTGGTDWAVFDGATRVAQGTGTTGQFTVARGKIYDVFAVTGPLQTSGIGATSVSPPAPPSSEVSTASPDTTAPVTVSNALSTYEGTATVNLTATDNLYGWGVAYIYYRVDEQPTRLSRVLPGVRTASTSFALAPPASGSVSHRVSYWAQDNYGNVEARTFTTITVTPSAPVEAPTSITIKTNATSVRIGNIPILSGAVTPFSTVGYNMVAYVMKPGKTYWTYSSNRTVYNLGGKAAWQYKYYFKPGMVKGVYKFKAVMPAYSGHFLTSTSPTTVSIQLR